MLRPILNFMQKKPIFAQYAITYACNSRCKSCWYWTHGREGDLTLGEVRGLVEQLWDFGIRIVTITGGEPFVRPDAIDIIRMFYERGFRIAINTNGILLDQNLIRKLSDIGKMYLMISLDSLDEDTYHRIRGVRGLSRILETLRYLKEETVHHVRTFTTVSAINYQEVPKIIDYCRAQGYSSSVYPVMRSDRSMWFTAHDPMGKEDQTRIAKLFGDLASLSKRDPTLFGFSAVYQGAAAFMRGESTGSCGAGEVLLHVSPDGGISACPESPPFVNIRTESLEEVYGRTGWRETVKQCYTETPCYIGCTRTLQSVRNAPFRFAGETIRKHL